MKKLTFVLMAALVVGTTTANAQAQKKKEEKKDYTPGLYIKGGLGYSAPQGGPLQSPAYSLYHNAFYPSSGSYKGVYTSSPFREEFDIKQSSFSAGFRGIIGLGLQFTRHIGAELNADIGILTPAIERKIVEDGGPSGVSLTITQQAKNPVLLTPSIVVQSGGKVNVYVRGGVVLPVRTVITEEGEYVENTFNIADSSIVTETASVGIKYNMRLKPGFAGAAGVRMKLNKYIDIWGEISIVSLTVYYKESEVTEAYYNGINVLSAISPNIRNSKYEFEGTFTPESNVYPTSAVSFNNIGLNVGVAFNIF